MVCRRRFPPSAILSPHSPLIASRPVIPAAQNGDVFRLKDCATLKPESEGVDPYLAQIISMWQVRSPDGGRSARVSVGVALIVQAAACKGPAPSANPPPSLPSQQDTPAEHRPMLCPPSPSFPPAPPLSPCLLRVVESTLL